MTSSKSSPFSMAAIWTLAPNMLSGPENRRNGPAGAVMVASSRFLPRTNRLISGRAVRPCQQSAFNGRQPGDGIAFLMPAPQNCSGAGVVPLAPPRALQYAAVNRETGMTASQHSALRGLTFIGFGEAAKAMVAGLRAATPRLPIHLYDLRFEGAADEALRAP